MWTIPLFVGFVLFAALVVMRPVENLWRDFMMSTISPFHDVSEDIVLVTITEETLKQMPYRSPIDRQLLADVVTKIAAAGPKVIGIDILFDQPSEPEKDAALERAIAAAGVPVVIASADARDGLLAAQAEYLAGFSPKTPRGLATLARDPIDGVVRELFAGRGEGADFQPGFATAVAMAAGMDAPRRRRGMVYYRGEHSEPYPFPRYPAHTAGLLPASWFAGKYVLIGVDLPLDDRHLTSFIVLNGVAAGTMPGVVVHAHALSQILAGDRIVPTGLAGALLIFFAGLAVAGWFAWRPLPVLFKPPLIVAVLLAMWLISALAFALRGMHVPIVAPSILVAGLSGLVAFLAWRRDRAQKRFIERAFAQYVSPQVVKAIVADPDSLRLGGERRVITSIFTDLQGFTTISEKMAPEAIAAVLNDYLDRICNLFVQHGATIDKVIGDAVVGFFGAPAEQDDQGDRAVGLALAVDLLSEDFRKEMKARGYCVGMTRIGIHTGPAIVGNFGGERFFDYTAIGDTVNTAARLEGANKYVGTRICVSEAVVACARAHRFRPSGTIFLKGKSAGIAAFEPLHAADCEQGRVSEYERAFAMLKSRQPAARKAFHELSTRFPNDRLIGFHARRLENGEYGTDIILSEK